MDTVEAIKIFEVISIDNIDETDIKKKYRALMKKVHPDNVANTLVDAGETIANLQMARDILLEYVKVSKLNESKYRKKTYFINIDKLQKLYNKEKVSIGNDVIDVSDLTYSEVYLELVYEVWINNLSMTSRSICHYRSSDIYDIYIDVPMSDCSDDIVKVTLKLEGNSISESLSNIDIIRTMQYSHNIRVAVHLNRKQESKG